MSPAFSFSTASLDRVKLHAILFSGNLAVYKEKILDQDELIGYLEPAIKLASASDDEMVHQAAVVLLALKGSMLGGSDVMQVFTDVVAEFCFKMKTHLESQLPPSGGQ